MTDFLKVFIILKLSSKFSRILLAVRLAPPNFSFTSSLRTFSIKVKSYFSTEWLKEVCSTAPEIQERLQIGITSVSQLTWNKLTFCIHTNIFRSVSTWSLSSYSSFSMQTTNNYVIQPPETFLPTFFIPYNYFPGPES